MKSKVATVLMAAYLVFLGFLTLWPTHPDALWQPFTTSLVAHLGANSATSWITFDVLNDLANAVLFVVVGVLAILAFGRRGWWWVFIAGCVLAGGLEVAQTLFLPERTADVADVISGAIGVAVGDVIGVGILAVAENARRRRRTVGPTTAPGS